MTSRAVSFALVALLTAGCYRTTIYSGRPVSPANPTYEDKWRSAALGDIVDIDGATPLDLHCRETGWAQIDHWRSVGNWLVDVFLAGTLIYESNRATVQCAAPTVAAPVAPWPTAPAPPQ
jgi:hypothetical protein